MTYGSVTSENGERIVRWLSLPRDPFVCCGRQGLGQRRGRDHGRRACGDDRVLQEEHLPGVPGRVAALPSVQVQALGNLFSVKSI